MPTVPRAKRHWRISVFILLGFAATIVLLLVAVVLQVDDWGRDLSQNHAATVADAIDPALRPIVTAVSVQQAASAVERAANTLPRWQVTSRSNKGTASMIALVRTTPLFRFKDDITVRITATEAGALIQAESQSQVGKGDLGQNPRNLRELLDATRAELKRSHEPPAE